MADVAVRGSRLGVVKSDHFITGLVGSFGSVCTMVTGLPPISTSIGVFRLPRYGPDVVREDFASCLLRLIDMIPGDTSVAAAEAITVLGKGSSDHRIDEFAMLQSTSYESLRLNRMNLLPTTSICAQTGCLRALKR